MCHFEGDRWWKGDRVRQEEEEEEEEEDVQQQQQRYSIHGKGSLCMYVRNRVIKKRKRDRDRDRERNRERERNIRRWREYRILYLIHGIPYLCMCLYKRERERGGERGGGAIEKEKGEYKKFLMLFMGWDHYMCAIFIYIYIYIYIYISIWVYIYIYISMWVGNIYIYIYIYIYI